MIHDPKIFSIALVFGVCSCSPKGDGSVSEVIVNGNKMYVSSLSEAKSDITTVPLSSFVEDCIWVQLETNENAYFSPQFTTVTDKYIGVRDRQGGPYKLFDRSGKFLCSVGLIGNGPGEYNIALYDDIIDDKNELIYFSSFTADKILVYNTSGKFLKNIVTPHRMQKPKMFLHDGILTVVHIPFPNDKAIAFQFDVNTGKILKELAPPEYFIENSFSGEIFNTRNVQGVFDILYTGNDTLYHFDLKNNKIMPAFKLRHNITENPWRQYFQVNKDLIMTWMSGKLLAVDLKNKTSSYINVVNDYYGNMPVPMSVVHLRNGYWVHNIQPEDLMEDIENRLAERSCTENDRQILTKTLLTLKEGTNNVVFIGKLKTEVKTKLW